MSSLVCFTWRQVGVQHNMTPVEVSQSQRLRQIRVDPESIYLGRIGTLDAYATYDEDQLFIEVVEDTGRRKVPVAAVIDLIEDYEGVYSVKMVRIAKEFQGFNIAPELYRLVMRQLGVAISTLGCQSPGGQSIWTRMYKYKDVQITAYRRGSRRPSRLYHVIADLNLNRLDRDGEESIWDTDEWELVACVA